MTKATSAGEARVDRARRSKPPGPVDLAMTVFSLAALLCVYYDWWPARFGNMDGFHHFLFGALALLVLALAGLIWAVRTLYVVGRDQRWSRRILAAPSVVVVAVAAAMLFPPPSFDDMRPEFDRVAQEIVAAPGSSRHDVRIGGFEIESVRQYGHSGVYFIDADRSLFITSVGWVYSPHGEPTGFDDVSSTYIGEGWYEFKAVWRD